MKEQKAENFVRLAEKRMSKAFEELRKISNLGNSYIYEYTEEQANVIVDALQSKILRLALVFKDKPFAALAPEDFSFEDYIVEPEPESDFDEDETGYEVIQHTD